MRDTENVWSDHFMSNHLTIFILKPTFPTLFSCTQWHVCIEDLQVFNLFFLLLDVEKCVLTEGDLNLIKLLVGCFWNKAMIRNLVFPAFPSANNLGVHFLNRRTLNAQISKRSIHILGSSSSRFLPFPPLILSLNVSFFNVPQFRLFDLKNTSKHVLTVKTSFGKFLTNTIP